MKFVIGAVVAAVIIAETLLAIQQHNRMNEEAWKLGYAVGQQLQRCR